MSKFVKMTGDPSGKESYLFHCPGCGYAHFVQVNPAFIPSWQWNGSVDSPTVSPSLLVRGQFTCHSFIKDGKIQFLGDCDHALKGQTVEIPDWEHRTNE